MDGILQLRAAPAPPPPPAKKAAKNEPPPPPPPPSLESSFAVMPLLALSDGRIAGGDGSAVCIWRPEGGEAAITALRLEGHSDCVWALAEAARSNATAIGATSPLLVSASWDGSLRVWDTAPAAGGACLALMQAHSKRVWTLTQLSPTTLLSGSWDGSLCVWDIPACLAAAAGGETPRPAATLFDSASGGAQVWSACALGENFCASGGADGSITVWRVGGGGGVVHALGGGAASPAGRRGHAGPVSALCPLGGGRLLSGGWDGSCRLWHAQLGVCERVLLPPGPGSLPTKVAALAPLGAGRVAVASSDGAVRLWDAAGGEMLAEWKDHASWVTLLAALPDGRLLSAGPDNTVRVWDPASRRCARVFALPAEADGAYAVATPSQSFTVGRVCLSRGGEKGDKAGRLVQGLAAPALL